MTSRADQRSHYPDVPAASVVTHVDDVESESVHISTVEGLEHIEGGFVVRSTEVEIGGEAPGTSCSELPQCSSALEDKISLESPSSSR
jgi:hypothetical protein